jgi:hyaluronan synthase
VSVLSVQIPPFETELCEDLSVNEHCTQHISSDGRILVSKKAWILRIFLFSCMITLMVFNIATAIALYDPLIIYSTLMPIHTLAVFFVGWVFFRNKANGKTSCELVSVIVPVYNQASLIARVIDAIFKSTYKPIEVVAVDDGSKDATGKILDDLAHTHLSLHVIHQPNGGKRKAVARGFYSAKGKYVVLIDSDSVIDEYAIDEFMKTFNANPEIGGVVGNAKVLNADKNFLTKCQDAWYDYAFNIHKTTESTFGTVLCCSGCLAGYRREAIEDFVPFWMAVTVQNSDDRDLTSYAFATPWAKRELTPLSKKLVESMAAYDDSEDRGLTAHTLVEWKTVYVPTAVVYTEVPETITTYYRQQTRWKKGYVRSSFFVSAFFWKKHPVMALIFYTELMMTFVAPLSIFAIYAYAPFVLHHFLLPLTYVLGQLLIGVAAGLDYRFRNSKAKYWTHKPIMNLIASLFLPWLIFPALWNFRKNKWMTR